MSQTPFTINIEHDDVAITTATMYGMRYPYGTIQWVSDPGDKYTGAIDFQKVADGDQWTINNWLKVLDDRANKASIAKNAYVDQHRLVKRSITIAITAPEEV